MTALSWFIGPDPKKLGTTLVPNPNAGQEHVFKVYRLQGDPAEPVVLRERSREKAEADQAEEDE